eukprot:5227756-Amphidinium_carterae.1
MVVALQPSRSKSNIPLQSALQYFWPNAGLDVSPAWRSLHDEPLQAGAGKRNGRRKRLTALLGAPRPQFKATLGP